MIPRCLYNLHFSCYSCVYRQHIHQCLKCNRQSILVDMITNTKADGKKGEREIQVTIHIDSVLACFESFWRLHDMESCTEICSVPVKLCLSPLNSGLQYTWMIPLCFFFNKWQLNGCRGGYFENIRQFPKLNKLSISIIVVNYNN